MNQDQKTDKILEAVTDIKVELAKHIIYHENHAKKLNEHESDIKVLNAYKNQWIGKTSILSLVFGAIGAGITFLIKYLTSPHE